MTLVELTDLVRIKWQFDGENYPALLGEGAQDSRDFAIRHIVLHQMKSLGKLAADCEATDHGGEPDSEATQEAAVKMLVNAIQLMAFVGLTPEILEERIRAWAGGGSVRYVQFEDPRTGEPLYRSVSE